MLWSILFGLPALFVLLYFEFALEWRMAIVFSLCWLRYEWHFRLLRADVVTALSRIGVTRDASTYKVVNENFELCRSVVNLTDQHALLCEIRSGVRRTLRCARAVLDAVEDVAPQSHYPASDSHEDCRSTPKRWASSPSLTRASSPSLTRASSPSLTRTSSPSLTRTSSQPPVRPVRRVSFSSLSTVELDLSPSPVLDPLPVSYAEVRRRFRVMGGSLSDGCLTR